MQAYKGLYEDQLQTQHASAESYRSLTRGYSRLSADNKALRQQTAAAAAGVTPTATFSPSSDEQTGVGPFARTATLRAPMHGGEIKAAPDSGSGDLARSSCTTTDAVPLSGMISDCIGDVRESASAPLEMPAETVATAAAAVAAAAGALAKAAVSTEAATTTQPSHRASVDFSESMASTEKRRSGTSSTECASTVETFACSPFSDTENGTAAAHGVTGTALTSNRECSVAPSSAGAFGKQECSPRGDASGGDSRGCPGVEAYAFPTGGGPSTSTQQRHDARSRGDGGKSGVFSSSKFGPVAAAVAVPPVEPAPRWRGRSVGPGRLVASSASLTEAVDGPKRSSSPPPPRRGRWGEGGGGGSGWGSATTASGKDGCTRIEPSRARPHSI